MSSTPPPLRPRAARSRVDPFTEQFGEPLSEALRLDRWRSGADLVAEYARIQREVETAVAFESQVSAEVRRTVFPRLGQLTGVPEGRLYSDITAAEIRRVHRDFLFPGRVEACDGRVEVHESLALTLYQIAVCLVGYAGTQGSWSSRLIRRDLRAERLNGADQLLELLERRQNREDGEEEAGRLSQLAQRAVMSHAAMRVLVERSAAPWRMGRGSPAPQQLFMAAPEADLMVESVGVMRQLIEGHRRFVFLADESAYRELLTLGDALMPLEYAIVGTLDARIHRFLAQLSYAPPAFADLSWDGESVPAEEWVARFRDRVASQVLVGVYRASALTRPRVFYAHREHFEMAARIAIADSALLESRGGPMLLQVAEHVCRSVYGGGHLAEMAETVQARARTNANVGAPLDPRRPR